MLNEVGEELSVNVLTVKGKEVSATNEPDVPVMRIDDGPTVAVLLTVNVSTLVPVVDTGLNDAVTPLGRLEALKLTLPAKPLEAVTVIVEFPEPPCGSVMTVGEAPKMKFGPGFTVSRSVVVSVSEPEVPVTVMA
jgi:hypothetical protein